MTALRYELVLVLYEYGTRTVMYSRVGFCLTGNLGRGEGGRFTKPVTVRVLVFGIILRYGTAHMCNTVLRYAQGTSPE